MWDVRQRIVDSLSFGITRTPRVAIREYLFESRSGASLVSFDTESLTVAPHRSNADTNAINRHGRGQIHDLVCFSHALPSSRVWL